MMSARWCVLMTMSRMPCATRFAIPHAAIGNPHTGSIGLGRSAPSTPSRVPRPAHSMNARIYFAAEPEPAEPAEPAAAGAHGAAGFVDSSMQCAYVFRIESCACRMSRCVAVAAFARSSAICTAST